MRRFGFAMGLLGLLCALGAAAAGDGKGTEVVLDGYKATTPASWKKAEIAPRLKQFRLHQFDIGSGNQKAEVIVSPPFGGGVEQNIDRWKKQFTVPQGKPAPETIKFDVSGVTVTYLDIAGTYNPPQFDPSVKAERKENYRQLGAIFNSANGPFFIRFLGPADTVAENKQAFDQWLKSFKK
jgi:hypothetical protein